MEQKHIVIIEDEAPLANALKDVLIDEGYAAQVFTSSAEGQQHVIENDVDLLILDIMMPEPDGIAVLEAVRGTEGKARLPIIMLTNSESGQHMLEASAHHGITYYVKANTQVEDVVAEVKRTFSS